jgi:vancomycin resistance protein YoaR
MTRRTTLRWTTLGLLVAALGGSAAVAVSRWWPLVLSDDPAASLPGLRIDGERVAPGADVRAMVAARADALLQRRVRLVTKDGDAVHPVLEASLGELGVSVDVDGVTSRALRLGRSGDALTRAHLADQARRGELDVPLEPTVDTRVVVEKLAAFEDDLDVPAVSARLDLDRHAIVPEQAGRAVDPDGAADRVGRAALEPLPAPTPAEIELPFVPVAPAATRASLARIDISRVVASFQTYFSRYGDQGPRARNIEVAASHVDGLVIDAGQTISFNDVVGPRTEDNGFKQAFEIVKGEYKEGTGGGTCQVASTLHAIAFFGGMDILQRLPHSRPSAYIPSGLDATVVYPVVDLKLRNPFTFPLVVHAVVSGNVLKMELLGADKPVEVTFGKEVLSTTPYERKVEEDPAVSKPKRKQKGIDGLELFRSRVLTFRDGTRKVENSRDVYPPTREVWLVPPGFDASTLPALGQDLPADPPKPQAQAQATGAQG